MHKCPAEGARLGPRGVLKAFDLFIIFLFFCGLLEAITVVFWTKRDINYALSSHITTSSDFGNNSAHLDYSTKPRPPGLHHSYAQTLCIVYFIRNECFNAMHYGLYLQLWFCLEML